MRTGVIIFIFFVLAWRGYAQTPGLIIKPATGSGAAVLDPNGDGYTSETNMGFQNNDFAPSETELDMEALVRPDPVGDPVLGPTGSFNEIVGIEGTGEYAIFTYLDASNNFIVRFRLDGYAPNSKTYSLLIDTDQKFGFTGPDADPNAIPNNPGFEIELSLHTNFTVDVYSIDGVISSTPSSSYSYDTNCQKSIAFSTNSVDPDYFYDFFVPFSALSALGVTTSTSMRFVAVTTMNPDQAIANNALSDVGGETTGTNYDDNFETLIEDQTPTPPGVPILDRTTCPTITGPINTGTTSVTVNSSYGSGTLIKLYIDNAYITEGTISSGTSITFTGLTLTSGMAISASATATGMGESVRTCNVTFVGASCTERPVFVSVLPANKGVECNVTGPIGTVITLYGPNNDTETVILKNGVPDDNNPYTTTIVDETGIQIKGNTGQALDPGSYYIVAQAPSSCVSQRTYFSVGTCAATSATPAINTTTPYSSTVTGTGGVSGAIMYLYADGILIREKTLTATGSWSMLVDPSLICNTTLTAQQVETGKCISALSPSVVVGQNETSAPTISVNTCSNSITTISGYSGEADGTSITVYVAGSPVGTTTVTGGAWSLSASASVGQSITATATNSAECKTVSVSSTSVSLTGTTALTGDFSVSSAIYDTTDPVPIDYTGLSASTSYTINLQIDGYTIGTTTFTSSATGNGTVNISPSYTGDLYIGGALSITLQSGSQCESAAYDLSTTVECQTPSFASSVISAVVTDACIQTSGEFILTNSQNLVIYTPVDISGTTQGYSTLGNGDTITLYTYPFPTETVTTFYVKAERITEGSCEAQSTGSVTFNSYDNPTITTQPSDQTVCSGDAASIPIAWTGVGPYDIQWQYNNGGGFMNLSNSGVYSQAVISSTSSTSSALSISSVTGLDGYSYQCIVTDLGVPSDCQSTTSDASVFTVVLVTISSSSITNSTSGSNGAISITAAGGDGNYSYDWHHLDGTGDFDDIEDLTGLAGGTYTVTVRDGNLCTYEESFTVGGIGSINLATVYSNNISCYGASDGNFKVRASTGTPPYSYSKDNFATSQTDSVFTGLGPGTYTVKAKDSNLSESNSVSIIITEPLEMVVYATISNPSVALNDGSIYATIVGGTANFNISLYQVGTPDVLISSLSGTSNRTPSFSGLSAGTYYINVTDANSCTASKTNIVLTAPTVTTTSCSHTASHSFNSNLYNGSDQTPSFFSSAWTESVDIPEIQIVYNAMVFGRIPSDNNSTHTWTTASTISRQIDLLGASSIVTSFKVQTNQASNSDNYTVGFYVNNNLVQTFTLNSNGAYITQTPITYNTGITYNTTNGNSTNTFEFRLAAGSARSNFRIDDFTLTFNNNLSTGTVTTPSTCDNGTIDLSVAGGYTPYTYDWANDGSGDWDDSQDLSGLAAGTYTAYVKDDRGCTSSQISATVASAPLTATISGVNPTCAGGGFNGSITATLTATGGGGPYTYKLIKNVSDTVATASSAATTKTFSNLGEGTYKVKIWQATGGCNTTTSTQVLTLPVVSAVLSSTGTTTFCNGDSTTVNVTITGGTSPYTIVLANGLKTINNYTSGTDFYIKPTSSTTASISSVTGAQSCVSTSNTGTIPITVLPLPTTPTSATVDRNNLCADDAGNISLSVVGGSGTSLEWYTGSCGGTAIGTGKPLVIASPTTTTTYYARYTTSCGNSSCVSITVTVNTNPSAPTSTGNQSVCYGSSNPSLGATPGAGETVDWYSALSGGTLLASGSTTYQPSVTTAGTYTFYAESRNLTTGCVSTTRTGVQLLIRSLPSITFNSNDGDNIICSGDQVIFTATGGTSYTFYKVPSIVVQGPGATNTYTTTSLVDGDEISVVVTDTYGCETTSSLISMTVNDCGLTISGLVLNDQDGNGNNKVDGTAISSTEGNPLYAVLIDQTAGADTVYAVASVTTGTYTFASVTSGLNLEILLTTTSYNIGDASPATGLPSLWEYTGEIQNDAGNTLTGNDGTIDGRFSLGVTTANEGYINFGIRKNFAPVANNDNTSGNMDTDITIDVTTNDTDVENELDISSVVLATTSNSWGTWSVNASGVVTFHSGTDVCGTATNTYTIQDNFGNTSNSATISIDLTDNIDPTVTSCPDNETSCSQTIDPTDPVFNDNCGVTKVTWVMSGVTTDNSASTGLNYVGSHTFNFGTTTITYTAEDAAGNSVTCAFNVLVNTTPVITNPGDQTSCGDYILPTITGTNLTGSEAYYTATGGGGTSFSAGQTIITNQTLYVFDNNNNCSDEESFNITINRLNLAVSDVSAEIGSDCPDFLAPFNAENSSYHPGVSEVAFRVARELSSNNNWTFNFTLSGTNVIAYNLALTGNDVTNPTLTSGNEQSGSINAGNNSYVDFTFEVINIPGSSLNITFTISNADDGVCSGETESNSGDDNDITHVLDAMPPVGTFN